MKVIRFLRPFAARRSVKGSFRLADGGGGASQCFAYAACERHFTAGEEVAVRAIKRGSVLVVADNPVMGEVVLDGATEGLDFEVLPVNQAVVTDMPG